LQLDVARAVKRVCPHWLAEEAEDLAQVALSRVLGRLRATAGRLVFTPGYLYRAAHSALVDEIRRRRRLREVPIDPDLHARSGAADPERLTAAREIRDALAFCLAGLSESRRRAVMLHLQGHSAAETSALLECSVKQTENLVYRGLVDLRTCLSARGVKP
jgi:RNA polymerase sigma-70 factor, ECF subfamily